jgi:hypothetical protein
MGKSPMPAILAVTVHVMISMKVRRAIEETVERCRLSPEEAKKLFDAEPALVDNLIKAMTDGTSNGPD